MIALNLFRRDEYKSQWLKRVKYILDSCGLSYMRRGITKWDICRDFLILRYIHILILAFVIFTLNK